VVLVFFVGRRGTERAQLAVAQQHTHCAMGRHQLHQIGLGREIRHPSPIRNPLNTLRRRVRRPARAPDLFHGNGMLSLRLKNCVGGEKSGGKQHWHDQFQRRNPDVLTGRLWPEVYLTRSAARQMPSHASLTWTTMFPHQPGEILQSQR